MSPTVPAKKNSTTKATKSRRRATASRFTASQIADLPNVVVAELLRAGLPGSMLFDLKEMLQLSFEELSSITGVSRATLHRMDREKMMSLELSDKVVRFTRLYQLAVKVLGQPRHAVSWLKSPQFDLREAIPLQFAKSEFGAQEVEAILWRIENSVY